MISHDELNQRLSNLPAPRVTKEDIESHITGTSFQRFGASTTVAEITLDNGYSVRGEAACVNDENYDQEVGERIAYDNAFDKLWSLYGFLMTQTTWSDANPQQKAAAA